MQQFVYRSAAEYDQHVRQMTAAGWTMTHHQSNADGTTSATWAPPQPPQVQPTTNRSDITKIAIITGAVVLFIVIAVLVNGGTSKGTPSNNAAATVRPTNSSSVLVPFNQMQGVDWLALTRAEQNNYVQEAMKTTRCPTGLSVNDVALGVTQAANTPSGRSTPAINLLAATLAGDGCVAQK